MKDHSANSPEATPRDPAADEKKPETGFTWGDGIRLEISPNKMEAALELSVDYADRYSADDLKKYLAEQNLTETVDLEAVERIFTEKLFNQKIVIARGIEPIPGEDGRIDWVVDLSILEGAKLVEVGGRVDWRERHHILKVEPEQMLARLVDPTEDIGGHNIYGQVVPAPRGKEVKFAAGKGTRISEDGRELSAEIAGCICREGEKISVSPTYNVQGNVDFKTGNIDFNETVIVSGIISTGFRVNAGQDIHVQGWIDGAEVSAGGSILINGGISGDHKARIRAGGNITAKFIDYADVEAQGDITVSVAITHSTVKTKGRVEVEGSKGVIVGGSVSAEREIITAFLGNENGTKTVVEIGVELMKVVEHKKEEEKKLESLTANYQKMQVAIGALDKLRAKGKTNSDQEAIRLKIVRSSMQIQGQIKQIQVEIENLNQQIELARKMQKGVEVKEVAWPGVVVRIMGLSYPITAQTSKANFRIIGDEIAVIAFMEQEEKKGEKKKEKAAETEEPAQA